MKTVVSIPDDLFNHAEQLAHECRKSRSQLYTDALKEYVWRHASGSLTDAVDRVVELVDTKPEKFVVLAARRRLARADW